MKIIGIGLVVFGIWYLISQNAEKQAVAEAAAEERKASGGSGQRIFDREGRIDGGGIRRGGRLVL